MNLELRGGIQARDTQVISAQMSLGKSFTKLGRELEVQGQMLVGQEKALISQ